MKNILCFGDSNTWGYVVGSFDPDTFMAKRMLFDERWPGILQNGLGESYGIIEAGLNGRTTNIDAPEWAERNGLKAIPMLLEANAPLDLIIIMLGTNDLKNCFNRSAKDIAAGLSEIIDSIRSLKFIDVEPEAETKILVVSPPVVYKEDGFGEDFKNASKKSIEYGGLIKSLCKSTGCYYLDVSDIKFSDVDGIHLEESSHKELGNKLVSVIRGIFGEVTRKL